jgi:hypothetical protein
METFHLYLHVDPTPWLLEPEQPSIRYWTMVDLLNWPASSQEVQAAKTAVAEQPLVKEIFATQHPDGYWGEDETKPYTVQGAVTMLNLLYQLGMAPDERTWAGCDSLLKNSQHTSGGLSMVKTTRSGIFPCTTGEQLPFLVYFGLQDDPRVRAAFVYLIQSVSAAEALDCGRYQHRDCLWGAIAILKGLAVLPTGLQTAQTRELVVRLANRLLDAPYDFAGEHKRWLTLGVPRAWDLLSALKALAAHGYAQDARFQALFERVLALQDEQGRWLCGSVSRTWPLEKRNQPSKWVTLDVMRILRQISGAAISMG